MKKIIAGIIIGSLLLMSNVYGYQYTSSDYKVLNNAYKKIDAIFEKSPEKIEELEKVINSYLKKLDSESQIYNLLYAIKGHIDTLQSDLQAELDSIIIVTDIVDIDTIKYSQGGKTITGKLIGVSPISQSDEYYDEAISYLEDLVLDTEIDIETDEKLGEQTSKNEILIYIFINGKHVNKELVNNGYAKRNNHNDISYKYSSELRIAENNATKFKRGVWKNYSESTSDSYDYDDYDYTPSSGSSTYRNYYTGPRGGCYYYNSNGNKTYVSKSYCY